MQISFIQAIDRALSGATTSGQSGPDDHWKTHWNQCVECQGDYFKENFIHYPFLSL